MELGTVKTIDINREMQQAYLDYAMSVIISRALPDARDGLKPVHRRILYAMYDMGLRPEGGHKKSARIVGEVLGKYHPHGDQAVYDAMARLAQTFSTRYPLVDGQGNFGSIDGDPPAAMRYTEAKMTFPAIDLLADIEKDTVDFGNNFDDTLQEPLVLPASIPNLLVNGATGIAVGMSTNIPPHNLAEVIDALNYMLNRWDKLDDINVDHLMQFIQGPDFPTGGVIIQNDEEESSLKSAYGTGRGRITVQARAHVEDMDRGRQRVIVTELPYMTNKSSLIERIAKLIREGKLEGISDLRDESDREGMRIVIELTKATDPNQLISDLYKRTPMRSTFSIINLALVEGEPRMLSLKQTLRVFLEHRLVVVRRRSEHDLAKARERAHILEGLRIALNNLDEVINLIRRAQTVETARTRLMKRFKLSERQATAILNMPLRRLASLERKKIEIEYKELEATIKALTALLRSPIKMRKLIGTELEGLKEKYADKRKTQIVELSPGRDQTVVLTAKDLVQDKQVWVTITENGLVSRTPDKKLPRQSGSTAPTWLIKVNTRDTIYLVSDTGETAAIAVHTLPEASSPMDGTEYFRLSPLRENDILAAVFNLPARDHRADGWFVTTVTRGGMVKKSDFVEVPGPSAQTFTLTKVNEGDRLGWVHLTQGNEEFLLATARGMAIRFSEEEVRPMGLVAAGVMGIKLKVGDEVIGSETVPTEGQVFILRSDGQAKRIQIKDFPKQGRYGQGVTIWKLPPAIRLAGIATGKPFMRVTAHLFELAPKMMRLDEAPIRTRPARGKSLVTLKAGDQVISITIPQEYPEPRKEEKPAPKTKTTTAKKSRARKAPAKKAPAKKAPAQRVSIKRAPVKKATTRKAPTKRTPKK